LTEIRFMSAIGELVKPVRLDKEQKKKIFASLGDVEIIDKTRLIQGIGIALALHPNNAPPLTWGRWKEHLRRLLHQTKVLRTSIAALESKWLVNRLAFSGMLAGDPLQIHLSQHLASLDSLTLQIKQALSKPAPKRRNRRAFFVLTLLWAYYEGTGREPERPLGGHFNSLLGAVMEMADDIVSRDRRHIYLRILEIWIATDGLMKPAEEAAKQWVRKIEKRLGDIACEFGLDPTDLNPPK